MANRCPARFAQAEVQRAIRAARKEGAAAVELKLGDEVAIRIPLVPDKPVADPDEVVL